MRKTILETNTDVLQINGIGKQIKLFVDVCEEEGDLHSYAPLDYWP